MLLLLILQCTSSNRHQRCRKLNFRKAMYAAAQLINTHATRISTIQPSIPRLQSDTWLQQVLLLCHKFVMYLLILNNRLGDEAYATRQTYYRGEWFARLCRHDNMTAHHLGLLQQDLYDTAVSCQVLVPNICEPPVWGGIASMFIKTYGRLAALCA